MAIVVGLGYERGGIMKAWARLLNIGGGSIMGYTITTLFINGEPLIATMGIGVVMYHFFCILK